MNATNLAACGEPRKGEPDIEEGRARVDPQALLRAESKHAPVRWLAALQQMIRSKRKSAAPRVGFCVVAIGALSI
jgi:hypothetical protein